MKTIKIHVRNDRSKEVNITLTKQQIKLLRKLFGLKNHEEISAWFLREMEDELVSIYENFNALKEDYENNIDEIIDVSAMGPGCVKTQNLPHICSIVMV